MPADLSTPFAALPTFDEDDNGLLNVVIEAPKGSRNKFDFEKSERNDRFIGVMHRSREYGEARSLEDIPVEIIEDIEHFFRSYNQAKGIEFKPLGRCGPAEALDLIKAGMEKHRAEKRPSKESKGHAV